MTEAVIAYQSLKTEQYSEFLVSDRVPAATIELPSPEGLLNPIVYSLVGEIYIYMYVKYFSQRILALW